MACERRIDCAADVGGDRFEIARGINYRNAGGLGARHREEALAHPAMELDLLALETVRPAYVAARASAGAFEAGFDRTIEHDL